MDNVRKIACPKCREQIKIILRQETFVEVNFEQPLLTFGGTVRAYLKDQEHG